MLAVQLLFYIFMCMYIYTQTMNWNKHTLFYKQKKYYSIIKHIKSKVKIEGGGKCLKMDPVRVKSKAFRRQINLLKVAL